MRYTNLAPHIKKIKGGWILTHGSFAFDVGNAFVPFYLSSNDTNNVQFGERMKKIWVISCKGLFSMIGLLK